MPISSFPTYLVPSLPFRRRQSSSASSTNSVLPSSSPPEETYLASSSSHLRCVRCLSDLALTSQVVSKGFTGRHGRAYLVAPSTSHVSDLASQPLNSRARNSALPNLPNTFTDRPVPRQLVTGAHTVSDIHCTQCGVCLGWKYLAAEEDSQKYKVGKFILETKRVCRSSMWEMDEESGSTLAVAETGRRRSSATPPNLLAMSNTLDDQIEFDSQDEDECEDLFMGVWTPQAAMKRRRSKAAASAANE